MIRPRYWSSIFAVLALLLGSSAPSRAQSYEAGSGVTQLTNWPDSEARRVLRYDILPFIDTLTVRYEYGVEDGAPYMDFFIEWQPGTHAIYRGALLDFDEIPGDVKMAALDLRFGVFVDGQRSATLSLVVDSMVVGPSPDFVRVTLPDLTWENVFADATVEDATSIFQRGLELGDLEIAGAGFAVFDEAEEAVTEERRGSRTSYPRRVSIYRAPHFVDVFVDVSWLIGGHNRYRWPNLDDPRGSMGRGDAGRTTDSRRRGSRDSGERKAVDRDARDGTDTRDAGRTRSSERDNRDSDGKADEDRSSERDNSRAGAREDGGFRLPGKSKGDDDDEDDDDKLVPYAIAAGAAAGVLAIAGGTIGYYGSPGETPIGLTSGFVGRDGGLLLQVAVNEALLMDEPRPKELKAKLLSFGNFFRSSIQPALGAGVLTTLEDGEIDYEPSISVGAVGTYKMLLFYGGFDVVQLGPEFGIALNFRSLRSPRE